MTTQHLTSNIIPTEDWIWDILCCPECRGELQVGESEQEFACTNVRCGFHSTRSGRRINCLPRNLNPHQVAEHQFRLKIMDRISSAHIFRPAQQETFRMLNIIQYYSFTSQYYFFRDYFSKKYQLEGRGLEIGGATGQVSAFIRLFFPNTQMILSDVAPVNIELAEKIANHLGFETDYFMTADAERLPFKTASFDFMFSSGMLHHLSDLRKALRQGYNALKPGAKWYVVNELSIGSLARVFWNSRFGQKGKWSQATGILEQSYTMKEWRQFFAAENFTVREVHFYRNPRHKLESWQRALYYAFISKIPAAVIQLGLPCEVNFVLQKCEPQTDPSKG